jgi:glyoxylase-like metal-dependent hydrolase (beta-lactamase superfamily II)
VTHSVSDEKGVLERREAIGIAVPDGGPDGIPERPEPVELTGIRRFEVRTPTLPPATHTNVYIVGEGDLVVVDPASPYPEERSALKEAISTRTTAGERVAVIFLTHQHLDHVAGAAVLKRATGAPIWAHAETARLLAGRLSIDRVVAEGERLPAGGVDLDAVFTPGHAPGHLCLLERRSRALVCGDMVASIGTIIIDAEDEGDMAVYLASLERLRRLQPRCLLPSHGPPIWNADEHLAGYVAHRLMREGKVKAALDAEARTLDELVPIVYADVAAQVWPLAKRSLLAHLVKLGREGTAVREGDRWRR